ncbi:MAG: hypothetical protein ACKOAU_16770, partial [Pirellula sp.]
EVHFYFEIERSELAGADAVNSIVGDGVVIGGGGKDTLAGTSARVVIGDEGQIRYSETIVDVPIIGPIYEDPPNPNMNPELAIDRDPSTFLRMWHKFYNNGQIATASLRLSSPTTEPVTGLKLTKRNDSDYSQEDPKTVSFYGSNDLSMPAANGNWYEIRQGLPTNLGDQAGASSSIPIVNNVAYRFYKIVFDEIKNDSRGVVTIAEVSLQTSGTQLEGVESLPSAAGDEDTLTIPSAGTLMIGGEGKDHITSAASNSQVVVLGDLGRVGFDAQGKLGEMEIQAFNSPDGYRVDAGLTNATFKFIGDLRLWLGRPVGGVPTMTSITMSDKVTIDSVNLKLLFEQGFNHETDRVLNQSLSLFNGASGRFNSATGLFRNGGYTYELVELDDANNPGSKTITLKTVLIPGSSDGAVRLYVDSIEGQDHLGTSFSNYFSNQLQSPLVLGPTSIDIRGVAEFTGNFEFRESVDASGATQTSTWAFVSVDTDGLLRTGDNKGITIGFRRALGPTKASVELFSTGHRRVYGSGSFTLAADTKVQDVSGTVEIRQATSNLALPASTVQGVTINVEVPAFLVDEATISGDVGMLIGGVMRLQGLAYFYERVGGGLDVVLDGASPNSKLVMSANDFRVGVVRANAAMIITPQAGIAIQSNITSTSKLWLEAKAFGIDLFDPSEVQGQTNVIYNDTGVAQDLTIARGRVGTLSLKVGVEPPDGFPGAPLIKVDVDDLRATMFGFVSLSGDFVVKRRGSGDLLMSSSSASLILNTGTDLFGFGIVNAAFGLLVE